METIIAILLWLGVLTPGQITQVDLDGLVSSHQESISSVRSDTVLLDGILQSQSSLLTTVTIIDPNK